MKEYKKYKKYKKYGIYTNDRFVKIIMEDHGIDVIGFKFPIEQFTDPEISNQEINVKLKYIPIDTTNFLIMSKGLVNDNLDDYGYVGQIYLESVKEKLNIAFKNVKNASKCF